jgi:GNAT superfamily N-acetyltransferase
MLKTHKEYLYIKDNWRRGDIYAISHSSSFKRRYSTFVSSDEGIKWSRNLSRGMNNRLEFIEDSPFDSLYVCEENGTILGLLGFRIRENLEEVSKYGEISVIVVDSGARRKGVGRFLMNYAEKLAFEKGCIGTWLVSGFDREEQAHQFYKELGYEITGYRFVKRF